MQPHKSTTFGWASTKCSNVQINYLYASVTVDTVMDMNYIYNNGVVEARVYKNNPSKANSHHYGETILGGNGSTDLAA